MESHACDSHERRRRLDRLFERLGAPRPPEWGGRQQVVCATCAGRGDRVLLAFLAQRLVPLRVGLLVPTGDLGLPDPDMVELRLQRGDWTLWPIVGVERDGHDDEIAVLAGPLVFVDCPGCGSFVRLGLDELRPQLPATRALVA
jgi:hypothetical protein